MIQFFFVQEILSTYSKFKITANDTHVLEVNVDDDIVEANMSDLNFMNGVALKKTPCGQSWSVHNDASTIGGFTNRIKD